MLYTHVILEIFCMYGMDEENEYEAPPHYCKYGVSNPGYHCLENSCKYNTFTEAPNEIAFAGEKGVVPGFEAWVGFGGDMEPKEFSEEEICKLKKLWEEICRKKINEAYKEYMLRSGLDLKMK